MRNLITIEKQPRKNGGPRIVYICRSNQFSYDEWYGMTEYFRRGHE